MSQRIEEAAGKLLKFSDRIDTNRLGEPAVLGVIIGSGPYAYRRNDGIWVIPIGVCGPRGRKQNTPGTTRRSTSLLPLHG